MEYSSVSTSNTTVTTVTIEGLLIFTEYRVRVRAATSVGSGQYSGTVFETTLEDGRSSTQVHKTLLTFSSLC